MIYLTFIYFIVVHGSFCMEVMYVHTTVVDLCQRQDPIQFSALKLLSFFGNDFCTFSKSDYNKTMPFEVAHICI